MSDLSAADVLAMTKDNSGFLEGNGIIILLLFLLFLGGGSGSFGSNGSANFTRAEVMDEFNNQNTVNSLNNLNTGINNGFNSVNMGLSNGFNSVNQNLNNLGFAMQNSCCDIKTTIHAEGEATRALINANTMQDLRDKLNDKDRELNSAIFAASQLTQTNTIEQFILDNKSST